MASPLFPGKDGSNNGEDGSMRDGEVSRSDSVRGGRSMSLREALETAKDQKGGLLLVCGSSRIRREGGLSRMVPSSRELVALLSRIGEAFQ